MRVDWCVSSWFRIKNSLSRRTCVEPVCCERELFCLNSLFELELPVCVCVSLVRAVIICPASTHTALVSSPSLAVLHLTTYLPKREYSLTHK